MEKKQINKGKLALVLFVIVCLMALSFGGGYLTYYLALSQNQKDVSWAIGLIDDKYMVYDEETGEIKKYTSKDYMDKISELFDPYSDYYSREEFADEIRTSQGNHYGVGVSFSLDKSLTIIMVAGNSPAEKAGIKVGSEIVGITNPAGVYTALSNYDELGAELAKISKETNFQLRIKYNGETKDITVSRQIYNQSYVSYTDNEKSYKFVSDYGKSPIGQEVDGGNAKLAADTGYIKFLQFEGAANAQFAEAYNYMESRGKTKLILDMRDNGGGFMNILQDIAEYLVGKNGKDKNLVTLAKYKNGKEETFYTKKNHYKDIEIVVLANDGSASATECLIGAMLHYGTLSYDNLVLTKNAEGVGRTYGKGIMQTTIPNLFGGNAIKLTCAYIYWPDKTTNIHGKGIIASPDNAIEKNANLLLDNELDRAIEILAK